MPGACGYTAEEKVQHEDRLRLRVGNLSLARDLVRVINGDGE